MSSAVASLAEPAPPTVAFGLGLGVAVAVAEAKTPAVEVLLPLGGAVAVGTAGLSGLKPTTGRLLGANVEALPDLVSL